MQKLSVTECNESLIARRHFTDASAWLRLGRLEFKLVHFLRDVQPVGGVEIPLRDPRLRARRIDWRQSMYVHLTYAAECDCNRPSSFSPSITLSLSLHLFFPPFACRSIFVSLHSTASFCLFGINQCLIFVGELYKLFFSLIMSNFFVMNWNVMNKS